MKSETVETTCSLGEVEFLEYHISHPAGELERTITGTISFEKDIPLSKQSCKIRVNKLDGPCIRTVQFIGVTFPNIDELDLLRAHRKYIFTAENTAESYSNYYNVDEEKDLEQVTVVIPAKEE